MTASWNIAHVCLVYLVSFSFASPHDKRAVPIPRPHKTVTNTTEKSVTIPYSTRNMKTRTCPLGHLPQKNGSRTFCCQPVVCGPGFEIHTCQVNGSRDVCVKCKDGYLQVNNISSFNMEESSCFEDPYLGRRRGCSIEDHKVSRTQPANCAMFCECRTEDCYVGNPCGCHKVKPCGVNHQLNKYTQECELCPEYSFKPYAGCGRCTYNLTAFSHGITIPSTTTTESTTVITKIVIIDNNTENGIRESHNKEKDDSSNIVYMLVVIIAALIFIGLVICLFFMIRYLLKRRNCLAKPLCPPDRDPQHPRQDDQRLQDHIENEEQPLMMNLKEIDEADNAKEAKEGQPDSGYSSNETGRFNSNKSTGNDTLRVVMDEAIQYDTSFNSGGCNSEVDYAAPGTSAEHFDTERDRSAYEISLKLGEPLLYSEESSLKLKDTLNSDAKLLSIGEILENNEKDSSHYLTLSGDINYQLNNDPKGDTCLKQIASDGMESLGACCSPTSVAARIWPQSADNDDTGGPETGCSPTNVAAVRLWSQTADKSIGVQRSLSYTSDAGECKKERKVAKVGPMPRDPPQSQINSIQSSSLASTVTSYGEVHMSGDRSRDFSDESVEADSNGDRREPEGDSYKLDEDTPRKDVIPSENTVPKSVDNDLTCARPEIENEINLDNACKIRGAAFNEVTKEKDKFDDNTDTLKHLAFSHETSGITRLCAEANNLPEQEISSLKCPEPMTADSFDALLPSNDSSVEIPMQSVESYTDSVEVPLFERGMGDGAYSVEIDLVSPNNDLNTENDDDDAHERC